MLYHVCPMQYSSAHISAELMNYLPRSIFPLQLLPPLKHQDESHVISRAWLGFPAASYLMGCSCFFQMHPADTGTAAILQILHYAMMQLRTKAFASNVVKGFCGAHKSSIRTSL